jgi:hypothetical protein
MTSLSACSSGQYLYFCTSKASKESTENLHDGAHALLARREGIAFNDSCSLAEFAIVATKCPQKQLLVYASIRQHTSAYVSIRQHTSASVSIRQHTSAYVSIRSVLVY